MSDLRVRRARSRGRAVHAFALVPFLVLFGCGSGESTPRPIPEGIDLPRVGTLGRQPAGPGTIVVDVTSDGRISVGGKGPLSIIGLRNELIGLTADARWREPDRTSLKILLVNADASLPWTVAQWIMQTAADPQVALYRIFFGARALDSGDVGALGWTLPKDGPPWHGDCAAPPPQLAVRLVPHEGPASEPEDILAPLRAAAGERPVADIVFEVNVGRAEDAALPTGFVVEVIDVALRAGVRTIRFEGAIHSETFDPDDVDGLLTYVAELRAKIGSPVIRVGGQTLGALPASEPVPVMGGRLDHLYGSGVEREEPKPAPDAPRSTIQARTGEEETKEVVEAEGLEIADLALPFDGPSVALPNRANVFPTRDPPGRRRSDPVERALIWLARHQSPDGGWEAEGFGRWCEGKKVVEQDRPDGWGNSTHDVGVTGLALCAFLGAGYTNRGRHAFAKTVSKGLRYLKHAQDTEGCFGPRTHTRFVYDHAAAALAMVEAYGMTQSPIFRASAQKALDFILACRNPDAAWRYGVKPGDNDTSVTAWMTMPLIAARMINEDAVRRGSQRRLNLDDDVFATVHAWLDRMTDPETGRTGYREPGGRPDRPANLVELFPPERSESTTAAAVLLRILLGEAPHRSESVLAGAALLEAGPPVWNPNDGSIDHVYWYFATLAVFQVGGSPWKTWNEALHKAVVGSQRTDTDPCRYEGSWDPLGPWGREGGRVASTALMTMTLEVQYRYARVFGAR